MRSVVVLFFLFLIFYGLTGLFPVGIQAERCQIVLIVDKTFRGFGIVGIKQRIAHTGIYIHQNALLAGLLRLALCFSQVFEEFAQEIAHVISLFVQEFYIHVRCGLDGHVA